ncbi:unnamed protein product [Lampetra fluviatilis]
MAGNGDAGGPSRGVPRGAGDDGGDGCYREDDVARGGAPLVLVHSGYLRKTNRLRRQFFTLRARLSDASPGSASRRDAGTSAAGAGGGGGGVVVPVGRATGTTAGTTAASGDTEEAVSRERMERLLSCTEALLRDTEALVGGDAAGAMGRRGGGEEEEEEAPARGDAGIFGTGGAETLGIGDGETRPRGEADIFGMGGTEIPGRGDWMTIAGGDTETIGRGDTETTQLGDTAQTPALGGAGGAGNRRGHRGPAGRR